MIGTASTTKPTAAGTLITKIRRMPLRYAVASPAPSPAAAYFAIKGNTTVEIATAKTPIGSSMSRVARLSTETAESLSESPMRRETAILMR